LSGRNLTFQQRGMPFDPFDTRRHVFQRDLWFGPGVLLALQTLPGGLLHGEQSLHHLFQSFQQRIGQLTSLRELMNLQNLRLLAS